MTKDKRQKLWQVAGLLLCAIALNVKVFQVEASEFSGGRITGPLLKVSDVGADLFVLALLLTAVHRKIAAGIGLIASLLSLPFYLYFTAPGPFRFVFKGEYTDQLQVHSNFMWDGWAVFGMLTITLAVSIYISSVWVAKRIPQRGVRE